MPIRLDGTNGISGVDGSASTPTYSGSTRDYGVYFPANNVIAITTAGSERMRITDTGAIGLGVSNPPSIAALTTASATLINNDGSYYGGAAYWNGSAWVNSVNSQGGWVIRNTSGNFTVYTGTSPGAAGSTFSSFIERFRIDGNGATTLAGSLTVQTGGGTITGGFIVAPGNLGTLSSGTTTLNPTTGNYQYYTNNGAHTIAAPSSDCAIDILVTNGASAGTITFSGFTIQSGGTGDAYATTNANRYILSVRRINGTSTYVWKALQ